MYNTEIKITYVMMNESILLEDRLQYLKDNTGSISTEHDPEGAHKDKDSIIQHLADNGDPTKNKAYTQYAVGLYKAKGLKQNEAPRLKDALSNFDKYKGRLTPDEKNISVKQYPNIQSIEDKVKPFIGSVSKSQKAKTSNVVKGNPLDSEGHRLVHEDKDLAIYHVADPDKSKAIYGGSYTGEEGSLGTNWCTASRSGRNLWGAHRNEKLYAVHDKATGKVYQFSHGKDSMGHPSSSMVNANNEELIDNDTGSVLNDDVRPLLKKLGSAIEKHPSLVPVSSGKGKPTGADKFASRYGSGAILDKMMLHSNTDIVKNLAMNPNLNPEQTDKFLNSSDSDLRSLINKNPSLTPEKLNQIFDKGDTLSRQEVSGNPSADTKLLHKALDFVGHGAHVMWSRVLKNKSAKPEILHRVFDVDENMDDDSKTQAAENPSADSALLHRALGTGIRKIQTAAVSNTSAKPEHLHRAFDENMSENTKVTASKNKSADMSLLHKALDSDNEQIQTAAVSNTSAKPEHLHRAFDENMSDGVKWSAAKNKSADSSLLHKALDNGDNDISCIAMNSPKVNSTHIDKGLDSPHESVNVKAVNHPKSSRANLIKASNSTFSAVKSIAQERLSKGDHT